MTIHERFPFSWKESYPKKKKEEKPNILNNPVETLDLNCRGYNVLKRHAINTIGELISKWDMIPRMKGCGVGTIAKIKERIYEVYPELKDKIA